MTSTRTPRHRSLMRMAGRFARQVKAWAAANGVPVIFCTAGQRKHLIAEQFPEENSVAPGVFLRVDTRLQVILNAP